MDCPICYEKITSETGVVTTSCGHSYHFACISSWLAKQEAGSCPCCRKEMSGTENFPEEAEADSDDESDEEDYEEVEFTRTELGAFLRAREGCYVERTLDTVCPELCGLTFTELNMLMIGVCGQRLTEEVWDELLDRQDDEEEEEEEAEPPMSLNITLKLTEDAWARSVEETADV